MYLRRKLWTYVVNPASLQTTVFPGLCKTQIMNGSFNAFFSQSSHAHVPANICSQCTTPFLGLQPGHPGPLLPLLTQPTS